MRVYQFEFQLAAEKTVTTEGSVIYPTHRQWFGSEREAVTSRLDLFKAGKLVGKKSDHEIWPVDIGTSKPDLLAWLRKECV